LTFPENRDTINLMNDYTDCRKEVLLNNNPCENKECRYWINHKSGFNCTIITADEEGPKTLDEIAKILNLSTPRVKQIENIIIDKLKKKKILKVLDEDD